MTVQAKRRKRNRISEDMGANSASHTTVHADSPNVGLFENKTLQWSLLSAIGVWLAFPPVGFWALAWMAPYGWLRVINAPQLDGRRPYRTILATGYVYWLLMTYWVTLPHFSAAIGWLFLAAYLSIYVLGFVALARWLVHRVGWSSVIAAPLAWVSMEVLRSYLFTGFALAPLSHSQVAFVPMLQIASFAGAYGVSFVVMLVAAAIERTIHGGSSSSPIKRWWPIAIAGAVVLACLAFGWSSMQETYEGERRATVAIVQGSLDTEFDGDQSKLDNAFKQYTYMTKEITSQGKIDLVAWPESMFRFSIVSYDESLKYESMGPGSYEFGEYAELSSAATKSLIAQEFKTRCLMGTGTERFQVGTVERYNTAALFGADGELLDSYYKMHPVMFGEYVPLGDVFPWLYNFTPMFNGLSRGTEPKTVQAGELAFAPNICFENTVPHLIRRQVRELEESGQRVDALITLTNDGWFWGSALLDLHLSCGIFRAIENRRPMLIAANTGFSAEIDPAGRVLQKGGRRVSQVIVADVRAPESGRPRSFYTRFGDLFAFGCVAVSLLGLVVCRLRK